MRTKYGEVSFTRDGHVAILEINRPPHNHVSVELMRDLGDALVTELTEQRRRKVVLDARAAAFGLINNDGQRRV